MKKNLLTLYCYNCQKELSECFVIIKIMFNYIKNINAHRNNILPNNLYINSEFDISKFSSLLYKSKSKSELKSESKSELESNKVVKLFEGKFIFKEILDEFDIVNECCRTHLICNTNTVNMHNINTANIIHNNININTVNDSNIIVDNNKKNNDIKKNNTVNDNDDNNDNDVKKK